MTAERNSYSYTINTLLNAYTFNYLSVIKNHIRYYLDQMKNVDIKYREYELIYNTRIFKNI